MADAAASNFSCDNSSTSFGTAFVKSFGSNSTPITPVEAGNTIAAFSFKALATARHEDLRLYRPCVSHSWHCPH